MPESRRRLLTALVGVAGVFAVEPLLAGLQGPGTPPKAKVYPNGRDPNRNTMDEPTQLYPRATARPNHRESKPNITTLYKIPPHLNKKFIKKNTPPHLPLPHHK